MKLRKTINSVLERFLVIILSLMVANVLWQVVSRYVLGTPSSFTDELSRYLMIWLSILGAAYVSGQNAHVSIDLLPQRFSKRRQRQLKRVVNFLILLFALFVLVIGGSRLVYLTLVLEQFSPSLKLPLGLVYGVIPFSGLLIIYYKTSNILTQEN